MVIFLHYSMFKFVATSPLVYTRNETLKMFIFFVSITVLYVEVLAHCRCREAKHFCVPTSAK